MDNHIGYIGHWIGSIISTGAIIGIFAGALPPMAAIGALIWYYIQITESETYRRWKVQRKARKIAHLRAELVELEATRALDCEKLED